MASSTRKWLNKHPIVVVLGSIVLLAGATAFVAYRYRPRPPQPAGKAYYYNTTTKAIFTDVPNRVAPFKTSEGHTAVRANFFTCGDCSEALEAQGGQRFLGYYEKYSDEVAQKLAGPDGKAPVMIGSNLQNKLFSADGENWVPADSPEGIAIAEAINTKCPPRKLRYCAPPEPVTAAGK